MHCHAAVWYLNITKRINWYQSFYEYIEIAQHHKMCHTKIKIRINWYQSFYERIEIAQCHSLLLIVAASLNLASLLMGNPLHIAQTHLVLSIIFMSWEERVATKSISMCVSLLPMMCKPVEWMNEDMTYSWHRSVSLRLFQITPKDCGNDTCRGNLETLRDSKSYEITVSCCAKVCQHSV